MRKEIDVSRINELIRFDNEVHGTENSKKYRMHSETKFKRNGEWTDWKDAGYGIPYPIGDDIVYAEIEDDKIYLIVEDEFGKMIDRYEVTEKVRVVLNIIV